jgi:hypothetical protein
MKKISRMYIFYVFLFVALIFALIGLIPRISAERENKTYAFIIEYKDILALAEQNNVTPAIIWQKIHPLGVEGISVQEYTGDDINATHPMSLNLMPFGAIEADSAHIDSRRASIVTSVSSPYSEMLYKYLKHKMPLTRQVEINGHKIVVLPSNVDDFVNAAFVPDFTALDFCMANHIPVLFRPGMCAPADGQGTAEAIKYLHSVCPLIMNVIPTGLVMAGNPDMEPIADMLKKNWITFSQTEFVQQVGVTNFANMMCPDVIPLHSLTQDEIISRNITRPQIKDRFIRAVHERSIRFIMTRPYDLQMGNKLKVYMEDLSEIKKALTARGYTQGWPVPHGEWASMFASALAFSMVLIMCALSFITRLYGREKDTVNIYVIAVLLFAALALGFVVWKVEIAAHILGGVCGALVATEASLTAFETRKKQPLGALLGLFIVIAGGLSIASFYGTTKAALRLEPFSGVKLTLLLPPLLILLHDFKRHIHPETVSEIVARSAIWGELLLVGIMMLAMLVMALRSDNVSNVPGWEIAFRDFMERIMLVRPRTKEFIIGYPALVVYWYVMRLDICKHYREAIRVTASLAFCSAVNTFCHFHTMLYLSLIRVLNGWWLGLVIGAIIVGLLQLITPFWRNEGRRIFN